MHIVLLLFVHGGSWFEDYRRKVELNQSIPGVWKWLHYFETYDKHLSRFRGTAVRVVECGVAGGGSLRMWREYFGENATLIGVDIAHSVRRYQKDPMYGSPDIMLIGDLRHSTFRKKVLQTGRIDVFLDDADHEARNQIDRIKFFLPHVAPRGLYLVEDVEGDRQTRIAEVQRFVFENFIGSFAIHNAARANGSLQSTSSNSDVGTEVVKNEGLNHLTRRGGDTTHLVNEYRSDVQQFITSVSFYAYVIVFERVASAASELPQMAAPWIGNWRNADRERGRRLVDFGSR